MARRDAAAGSASTRAAAGAVGANSAVSSSQFTSLAAAALKVRSRKYFLNQRNGMRQRKVLPKSECRARRACE